MEKHQATQHGINTLRMGVMSESRRQKLASLPVVTECMVCMAPNTSPTSSTQTQRAFLICSLCNFTQCSKCSRISAAQTHLCCGEDVRLSTTSSTWQKCDDKSGEPCNFKTQRHSHLVMHKSMRHKPVEKLESLVEDRIDFVDLMSMLADEELEREIVLKNDKSEITSNNMSTG